jgi:hypothetical protein
MEDSAIAYSLLRLLMPCLMIDTTSIVTNHNTPPTTIAIVTYLVALAAAIDA